MDKQQYRGPYHPSHLNTWCWCPQKLKIKGFKKEDKEYPSWPIMLGNMIHKIIENWHMEPNRDILAVAGDVLCKYLLDYPYILDLDYVSEKRRLDDIKITRECLVQYAKDCHDLPQFTIYTEVPCEAMLSYRKIKGTIDQIRYFPEQDIYQIIDIKTGKSSQGIDFEGLRRSYQLWTYAYCLNFGKIFIDGQWKNMNLSKFPEAYIFNFRKFQPYKKNTRYGNIGEPRKNRIIKLYISQKGFYSYEKRAVEVIRAIENNTFPPNHNNCSSCDVSHKCAENLNLDLTDQESKNTLQNIPGINL